jgi:hypothetical protein
MVARKAEYLQHLTDVHNKAETRLLEWDTPPSSGKHVWRQGKAHDLRPLARQK